MLVALAVVCAGCAAADWFRERPGPRSQAAELMAQGDELVRNERPSEARNVYARIVAEPARDAVHARALYSLARLYAGGSGTLRDYRAALGAFERLLTDYPRGERELDALAWRAALAALLAREADVARLKAELLNAELRAARLKEEAAKLKADIERLKRIDLNLERRQ